MADDDQHRRVEPRTAIPGSGMLTEPDRIRALENDVERKKRSWRAPPAEGFSSVLSRTPAKEQERIGTYVPADERFHALDDDETGAHAASVAPEANAAAEADAAPLPVDLDGGSPEDASMQSARATPAPAMATPDDAAADDARTTRRPRPNEIKDPRIAALHRLLDDKSKKKGA